MRIICKIVGLVGFEVRFIDQTCAYGKDHWWLGRSERSSQWPSKDCAAAFGNQAGSGTESLDSLTEERKRYGNKAALRIIKNNNKKNGIVKEKQPL